MSFNYEEEGRVTLDTIAQRRQWQLENLEKNTELLAQYVREEYANGVDIVTLSRRAFVSRPTIYRWIGGGTSDGAPSGKS